ncbi:LuxR C-terminal-related transcriptional regulator [Pontibacillus litoralis]|uniref:HTH luxR-type domain-containing protein n=1 Tax=Pontibacillus litoralis JSM 072002 TaxID=1385512 RepID=A0A0A5G8Z3_9BACI|nr:LuxR C-terminal-related transcriptional regulator [Pontibacillus litoralis]KGX87575.1 hypothetical protein N784_15115 [Pontibacillus litoralis JSM 072002]
MRHRSFERSWNHYLSFIEADHLIGRKEEVALFHSFIHRQCASKRIINIVGMGGIGKTFLLRAYHRIAQQEGVVFLSLNSTDFLYSPSILVEQMMVLLCADPNSTPTHSNTNGTLYDCLQVLNQIANNRQVVVAIDTYEEMGDMDRWFREFFLRHLDENVLLILSGRQPLRGEWITNQAWSDSLINLHLREWGYEQACFFLNKRGITEIEKQSDYWHFTKGHPLALALFSKEHKEQASSTSFAVNVQAISHLIDRLLREVKGEALHRLLEAAVILRHFDQYSLSYVLGEDVSSTEFHQLLSLSFVKKTITGWTVQEFIRSILRISIKQKHPQRYKSYNKQCALYYLHHIDINDEYAWQVGEYFYHLGEEVIQTVFFQESHIFDQTLEQVEEDNFHEVETYFQKRRAENAASNALYYNRDNDKTIPYYVSAKHNERENELIDASYVKELGYNVCHLVKNRQGDTIGISIVIPINDETVPILKTKPVSRAYFRQLSTATEKPNSNPNSAYSGWFIRMLDCLDYEDAKTRSFLLYRLFPLLLSGGKIVISTPIPFFKQLMQMFGFIQIEGATHYDYGNDTPSPTYVLDVSGTKLIPYLKQLSETFIFERDDLHRVADRLQLTRREKEIFMYVHEEYSNKEIAEELHVTEITVKKHVSNILKKFGVKNRTQLVKRVMEMT